MMVKHQMHQSKLVLKRILFNTVCIETGNTVISNAYMDLYEDGSSSSGSSSNASKL